MGYFKISENSHSGLMVKSSRNSENELFGLGFQLRAITTCVTLGKSLKILYLVSSSMKWGIQIYLGHGVVVGMK